MAVQGGQSQRSISIMEFGLIMTEMRQMFAKIVPVSTTVQSSMGEIGLQKYILGEPSQGWELRGTCAKKVILKPRLKTVWSYLPSLGILNMMEFIEKLINVIYFLFGWLRYAL